MRFQIYKQCPYNLIKTIFCIVQDKYSPFVRYIVPYSVNVFRKMHRCIKIHVSLQNTGTEQNLHALFIPNSIMVGIPYFGKPDLTTILENFNMHRNCSLSNI
jgi:hypothetical protein